MRGLAILDVDGTLSDFRHREHLATSGDGKTPPDQKAWDLFISPEMLYKDPPYPNCKEILSKLGRTHDLVYLTGRNIGLADVTQKWILAKLGYLTILGINLFMRPLNSLDKPTDYKRKQIKEILRVPYHSILAFDDDKYMHPVYQEFGAMTFKAPDCWNVMFPEVGKLPPEKAWRK